MSGYFDGAGWLRERDRRLVLSLEALESAVAALRSEEADADEPQAAALTAACWFHSFTVTFIAPSTAMVRVELDADLLLTQSLHERSLSSWEPLPALPPQVADALRLFALMNNPRTRDFELALGALSVVLGEAVDPWTHRDALSAIGTLWLFHHKQTTSAHSLREAIESLRAAALLSSLGPHDPGPSVRDLDDLGSALHRLYLADLDEETLRESVWYHGLAVEASAGTRRIQPLENYGTALLELAEACRTPEALHQATAAFREAMSLLPQESVQWWELAEKFSHALNLTSAVHGPGPELNAALREQGELIDGCEEHSSPLLLQVMASLLGVRYLLARDPGDLDSQIVFLRRALDLCEPPDPTWVVLSADLGAVLATRFFHSRSPEDLRKAVDFLSAASEHATGEILPLIKSNLGKALAELDLATAEDPEEHSVEEVPEPAEYSLREVISLQEQYATRSNPAFLDQGIQCAEAALEEPMEKRIEFSLRTVLAALYKERSLRNGSGDDLDRGIVHLAQTMTSGPPDLPHSPYTSARRRSDMGEMLRVRFEQRGDLDDLDRGIEVLRLALRDEEGDEESGAVDRNRLGLTLIRRYEHNRDLSDLRLAARILTEAAEAEASAPLRASILNNLGSAHGALHLRTADPEHLDKSVACHRSSVDLSIRGSLHHATRLSNLSMALRRRYGILKAPKDLQDALTAAESAVRDTPPHDVERVRRIDAYAALVRARHEARHDPADLRLMIDLAESALRTVAEGQVHRAGWLTSCARNLLYTVAAWPSPAPSSFPSPSDLIVRALSLLDHAWRDNTSLVHDRAEAARLWALVASAGDPAAAVERSRAAFGLFAAIDWHGMRIPDRVSLLRSWAGFSCQAAGWAIGLGRYAEAVRFLEEGRGRLWAQIADSRTLLVPKESAETTLVEQLNAVRSSLDRLTGPTGVEPARAGSSGTGCLPPQDNGSGPFTEAARGRLLRRLNAERRRLLAELTAADGRAEPATSGAGLSLIGADGPAVLLNVSGDRCDALVLHATESGTDIHPVPLPGVSAKEIEERVRAFTGALAVARKTHGRLLADRRAGRGSGRMIQAAFHSAVEELDELLVWGWETLTGPVIASIPQGTDTERAGARRILWGATGPLTLFPLHATGHHDGSGRSVVDRVVSSDLLTLGALARAARLPESAGPARLLSAGVPLPRGRTRPLGAVAEEIAAVAANAPIPLTSLDGERATRDRLLSQLSQHTWFHFAGHGTQGINDPGETALSTFDEPLTLADLAAVLRADAELAFLSSCHGATPSPDHPDEALHLAAAFHSAGFRHVIAARHPVDDLTAGRIATGFYQQLRHDLDPGLALHRTLLALRTELVREREEDDLVHPFAWIGHTHLGPAGPIRGV
ncbi:CHAT domain-containing protein [Streptomyces sp. NPDC056549]|uniref:CHAT domain-containing protein n=1 Tax=Streptomyces sp. NPDC056549 TaxID=3345864 RepID=UPI0036A4122F